MTERFTRLPVVLASGSATRRILLEQAGLVFEVRKVAVDEAALRDSARAEGSTVEEAALLLADAKAARVRDPGVLVIAADQILECEGQWFEKPVDLGTARAQLLGLRGRTHRLVSAVVCRRGGVPVWHHLDSARLTMRDFSDGFLDAYLAAEGDAVLGSVGCYRLEGPGVQLFDRVDGAHTTILGLPLLPLLAFLRQHGALLG